MCKIRCNAAKTRREKILVKTFIFHLRTQEYKFFSPNVIRWFNTSAALYLSKNRENSGKSGKTPSRALLRAPTRDCLFREMSFLAFREIESPETRRGLRGRGGERDNLGKWFIFHLSRGRVGQMKISTRQIFLCFFSRIVAL